MATFDFEFDPTNNRFGTPVGGTGMTGVTPYNAWGSYFSNPMEAGNAPDSILGQNQNNNQWNQADGSGSGNTNGMTQWDYMRWLQQNQPRPSGRQQAIANQNRFAPLMNLLGSPSQVYGPDSDYLNSFNKAMASQAAEFGRGGYAADAAARASMNNSANDLLAALNQAWRGENIANIGANANRDVATITGNSNQAVAGINTTPANRKVDLLSQLLGIGGGTGGGTGGGGINIPGIGTGGGIGGVGGIGGGGSGGTPLDKFLNQIFAAINRNNPYAPPPVPAWQPRDQQSINRELAQMSSMLAKNAASNPSPFGTGTAAGRGLQDDRSGEAQRLMEERRMNQLLPASVALSNAARQENLQGALGIGDLASKLYSIQPAVGGKVAGDLLGSMNNQRSNDTSTVNTLLQAIFGILG